METRVQIVKLNRCSLINSVDINALLKHKFYLTKKHEKKTKNEVKLIEKKCSKTKTFCKLQLLTSILNDFKNVSRVKIFDFFTL